MSGLDSTIIVSLCLVLAILLLCAFEMLRHREKAKVEAEKNVMAAAVEANAVCHKANCDVASCAVLAVSLVVMVMLKTK